MKTISKIPALVALLAAVVGFVFYLVTSFTGYLANASVNPLPILFTIVAAVALAAYAFMGNKLIPLIRDVLLLAAGALLIVGFAQFALGRVTLAADVYFIPVNYPEAEQTALNLSFAGLACYLISVLAVMVAAFKKG